MEFRYSRSLVPTLIMPSDQALPALKSMLNDRIKRLRLNAIQRRMVAYQDARFLIRERFKPHHYELASVWACKRMEESLVFYAEDRHIFDSRVVCRAVPLKGVGDRNTTAYELFSNNRTLETFNPESSFNIRPLTAQEVNPDSHENLVDISDEFSIYEFPNLNETGIFDAGRYHHAYQAAAIILIRNELSARPIQPEERVAQYKALVEGPDVLPLCDAYAQAKLIELPENYTQAGMNIGGIRHRESAHAFELDIQFLIEQE